MITEAELIVIDHDPDDQQLFRQIFEDAGYSNKLVFFDDSAEAYEYLANPSTWPFIIICEINMPQIDGYELRQMILEDPVLNHKSIPFIYLTTIKSRESVLKAYKGYIQGYFRKSHNDADYKQTIEQIMKYWKNSLAPE